MQKRRRFKLRYANSQVIICSSPLFSDKDEKTTFRIELQIICYLGKQ